MPRRILEGSVVSAKSNKTVTVLVERRLYAPRFYKKYVRRTDKFTAHDEQNTYKEGDKVQIMECRPISKTKRWSVLVDGKPFEPTAQEKVAVEKKPAKAKAEAKADKKPAAKAKAKKDA